jgi:hypothetical protein
MSMTEDRRGYPNFLAHHAHEDLEVGMNLESDRLEEWC